MLQRNINLLKQTSRSGTERLELVVLVNSALFVELFILIFKNIINIHY